MLEPIDAPPIPRARRTQVRLETMTRVWFAARKLRHLKLEKHCSVREALRFDKPARRIQSRVRARQSGLALLEAHYEHKVQVSLSKFLITATRGALRA